MIEYKMNTTCDIESGKIYTELKSPDLQGTTRDISCWVVETHDQQIKEALIDMGWTPPPVENKVIPVRDLPVKKYFCKHCDQELTIDGPSGMFLPPSSDEFGSNCPVRSTEESFEFCQLSHDEPVTEKDSDYLFRF